MATGTEAPSPAPSGITWAPPANEEAISTLEELSTGSVFGIALGALVAMFLLLRCLLRWQRRQRWEAPFKAAANEDDTETLNPLGAQTGLPTGVALTAMGGLKGSGEKARAAPALSSLAAMGSAALGRAKEGGRHTALGSGDEDSDGSDGSDGSEDGSVAVHFRGDEEDSRGMSAQRTRLADL